MLIKIPLYKRLLSYFYPLNLRRTSGVVNPSLELLLYQNRIQLATPDALYSDGDNYRPVNATLTHLKTQLPSLKTVLALGTGLGSLVHIMRNKGHDPLFTLVEIDKLILQWAIELLEDSNYQQLEPVCMDAQLFMTRNIRKFDLIFIDIFNSRVVPEFVTTEEFLNQCKNSLSTGGNVAFNYMINNNAEWDRARTDFVRIFPDHAIIDLGINRVLIGK